jgi:RNA polymerase sigma-70 factor (ECF subfamily)
MLTEMDHHFALLHKDDQRGLKYFYDKHYTYLHYYAYKITKDRVEAEDIVVMASEILWKRRYDITNALAVKPFLSKTVKNLCLNFLKTKKRKENSIRKRPAAETEYVNWINTEKRAEVMEVLQMATATLTARQKEILDLLIKGLSHKEIAEQLDITVQTVRSQKHNIIKWLKEQVRLFLAGKG